LEEARPGFVRWRAVSDSSHLTHFLTWREVIVEWTPRDGTATNVTWTLCYLRGLDPAWYFGPWERYAVRLAAGYLIDAVATRCFPWTATCSFAGPPCISPWCRRRSRGPGDGHTLASSPAPCSRRSGTCRWSSSCMSRALGWGGGGSTRAAASCSA